MNIPEDAKEEVNWNHDVAHRKTGLTNHIILRHSRFSLCGRIIRDEPLVYVGTWDTGEPCTCGECNDIWANMRNTAQREGLLE